MEDVVCRFISPLFEAETEEEQTASDIVIFLSNSPGGLLTTPVAADSVAFSPELTDNPFGVAGTLLILQEPRQLDRETRDLYTLQLQAISASDIAYATVRAATQASEQYNYVVIFTGDSFCAGCE